MEFGVFVIMLLVHTGVLVHMLQKVNRLSENAFLLAQNSLLLGKAETVHDAAAAKQAFEEKAPLQAGPEPLVRTADGQAVPVSHLERLA